MSLNSRSRWTAPRRCRPSLRRQTEAAPPPLNTDTNAFTWNITFSNLEGNQTAAHFHGAVPICELAGPLITLPLGSPIKVQATLSAQQAADVLAGLWYVNVHTNLHPGGEICGQVAPVPLDDPLPAVPTGTVDVKLEAVADMTGANRSPTQYTTSGLRCQSVPTPTQAA